MLARALWHINSRKSAVKENEIGEISHNQLLIRSMFSLISAGTERLVCKGRVPKELWRDMSVPFMGGSFGFPLKYGYSLVGIVTDGSRELEGKTVHLMHPHQDFVICGYADACVIPDNVPPRRAVFASNLETAINAVWDSRITIGDNVLIAGFGMIGALTAVIMKNIPGVNIYVHDIDHARISAARDTGFCIYPDDFNDEDKFDIAFNASGSSGGLQVCIDKTGAECPVIELSWYGDRPVTIRLGRDFHRRRKRIISSQVSSIPVNKLNLWSFGRRKKLVFDLLRNDLFDRIHTLDIPFEESPFIFEKIRQGTNEPGIVINY